MALKSHTPTIVIRTEDLKQLKEQARQSENSRARICLHSSHDDQIQEMLIALCKNTKVKVHRHPGRSESFHVVEGVLDVVFFNNDGHETDRLRLGEPHSGHPFMYRLNAPLWHTVQPITDMAIVHETVTGPFSKESSEYLENRQ